MKTSEFLVKMNEKTHRAKPVLVLFLCFITQALSMGFFVSFGTVYVELISIYHTTEAQAAWVGSIAISTCFFFGYFSSVLSKRFGCGNMISIGGALLGVGLLLSSIADDITTLSITFGGVTSIGCSFLYFSSLSVLPYYFNKHLCLATSIACCGTSLSGITFSPMMAYLIDQYNFQTCFQLFSITALFPLISGLVLQRYATSEDENHTAKCRNMKMFDSGIFANKRLLLVIFAMSLVELCYFTPYVHLVNFAIHNGITLMDASLLPVCLSIGSLIGKVLFGFVGQIKNVDTVYLFQAFLLVMAICLTLLPLATNFIHLIVFSMVYGTFDGAFTGFIVPVVATLVAPAKLGIALGLMYTILSVEILFGPPLTGLIYSNTKSYQIPFALCGGIIILAILLLFALPYIEEDKSLKKPLLSGENSIDSRKEDEKEVEELNGAKQTWLNMTRNVIIKFFNYRFKLKNIAITTKDKTSMKAFTKRPCYYTDTSANNCMIELDNNYIPNCVNNNNFPQPEPGTGNVQKFSKTVYNKCFANKPSNLTISRQCTSQVRSFDSTQQCLWKHTNDETLKSHSILIDLDNKHSKQMIELECYDRSAKAFNKDMDLIPTHKNSNSVVDIFAETTSNTSKNICIQHSKNKGVSEEHQKSDQMARDTLKRECVVKLSKAGDNNITNKLLETLFRSSEEYYLKSSSSCAEDILKINDNIFHCYDENSAMSPAESQHGIQNALCNYSFFMNQTQINAQIHTVCC